MMDADTLRMLQLEELDMAKQILQICEKHDIEVFALGGTLLGAVRHQGFIPWDDDLDLGMKRDEYERFMKIAPSELSAPLSMHTCYNDKSFLYPYIRVQNSDYGLQRDYTTDKTVQDLWVDIFPLDGVPAGGWKRKAWETVLTALRGLRNLSAFDALVNVQRSFRGLKGLIFTMGQKTGIQKLLPTNAILKAIDRVLKSNTVAGEACIGNPMGGHWFREVFPTEVYDGVVRLPFEDIELPCPTGYETILRTMYGDYMELPPEEMRNWHGTTLVRRP